MIDAAFLKARIVREHAGAALAESAACREHQNDQEKRSEEVGDDDGFRSDTAGDLVGPWVMLGSSIAPSSGR